MSFKAFVENNIKMLGDLERKHIDALIKNSKWTRIEDGKEVIVHDVEITFDFHRSTPKFRVKYEIEVKSTYRGNTFITYKTISTTVSSFLKKFTPPKNELVKQDLKELLQ